MIAIITGKVHAVQRYKVTLWSGPIAFELQCPTAQEYVVGQMATLHVHMHWSQDNGPSLSGFSDAAQKQIFQLVLSCQGVGVRTAVMLVAQLGVQQFVQACLEHDARSVAQVSGIGPKRAQQILLHVAAKVSALAESGELGALAGAQKSDLAMVAAALKSLRYSQTEISAALSHLQKEPELNSDFQVHMKRALAFLAQYGK